MAVRRLDLIITSNATAAIRGFVNLAGAANAAERRFGTFGAVAARSLGVAAVAGGAFAVASVKAFISFDQAMTESIAIMDEISGPVRKRMEDAAKAVARTTTFSATEAAGGFYGLASAGLTAEQQISALPVVAQFAQAGLMDLGASTDYLVNAQAALGLRMEDPIANMHEMQRVADVLTKTNNIATGTVEEFAEALTHKAGGALKAVNKDIEEGAAVLAAMAEQGMRGSRAGEALAVVLRDVPRAAQRNSEEFAHFGISVFDASGNLKNMADVVKEFEQALGPMSDGQRAAAFEALGLTRNVGDTLRQLLGTSDAIRTYEASLRGAAGTTATVAAKQMESLSAKLRNIRNRFEVLMIEFGEPIAIWLVDSFFPWLEGEFMPALREVGGTLATELRPAFDAIGAALQNPAVVQSLIALTAFFLGVKSAAMVVSVLSSVLGPVVTMVGFLLHPIKSLSLAWTAFRIALLPLTGALKALALAILGPIATALGIPVLLVGAIVVALVAAGVAIYIFRDEVLAALQAVGRFFVRLWDDIYSGFVQPIVNFFTGPFVEFWQGVWRSISEPVMGVFDAIVSGLSGIFTEIGESVAQFVGFWQGVWRLIDTPVMIAAHVIMSAAGALGGFLLDTFGNTFNLIASIVTTVLPVIVSFIKAAFTFVVSVFQNFGPVVIDIVRTVFGTIAAVFETFITVASNLIQFVMNVFQGDWGEAWDNIKNIFGALWDGLFTIVRNGVSLLINLLKDVPLAVLGFLGDMGPALLDLGINIVQGLWGGLTEGASWLYGQLRAFVGAIIDFFKNLFGISSPSTVFAEIGGWLIRGLWDGINAVLGPFFSAIGALFDAWIIGLRVAFGALLVAAEAVWNGISAVISFAWNTIIQPLWNALVFYLTNILVPGFTALMDGANLVWQAIVAVVSWAWHTMIQPVWNALQVFIHAVLLPAFDFLRLGVETVWGLISSSIEGAWNFIRDFVFNPMMAFIDGILAPAFSAFADFIGGIWEGIKNITRDVWNGIVDAVRGPVNLIIGIWNTLADAANDVLDVIGLGRPIPQLAAIAAPGSGGAFAAGGGGGGGSARMAMGGRIDGGFRTRGPQVIVGEGRQGFPEYVIPTDPQHRGRAHSLLMGLLRDIGMPAMGIGGIIGGIGDALGAGAGWVGDRIGDVAGGVFRGALTAAFGPANEIAKRAIDAVPNIFKVADVADVLRETLWEFVRGGDSSLMEHPHPPGPGGGGGSARGLVGHAAAAFAVFRQMFPGMTIGGWRARGSVPGSDHPFGKALDLMTTSGQVAAQIISTFMGQAGRKYWIWNRQIASAPGFAPRRYTGPHPHTDHVHLSYYRKGALRTREGFSYMHDDEMVFPADLANDIRRNGFGGGDIYVEPGAVVIQLPPGVTPEEAARIERNAGKEFMRVLSERRVMVDARTGR